MVQVDLITGFLGAGKTTFLRRYVRYLVQQGHKVCILENDFGAVNVDAMLVQEVLGPGCDVEAISGGCDCDTHQRRMRTKLIAMAMRGFDRRRPFCRPEWRAFPWPRSWLRRTARWRWI